MVTKILVLVLSALVCQSYAFTWKYHPTLARFVMKQKEERQCSIGNQILCKDCEHSSYCVSVGTDFLETELETCQYGKTCKQGEGCVDAETNKDECPLDQKPLEEGFVCETIGIYPDLNDCQTYHFCLPDTDGQEQNSVDFHSEFERVAIEAIKTQTRIDKTKPLKKSVTHKCDKGYGYDPMSGMCSVKLENGECPQKSSEIQCTSVGKAEPLSIGSSYFYVCHRTGAGSVTKVVPRVYRCPHGELFYKGQCAERDEEDNLKPPTIPSSSTTRPEKPTTCKETGRFPDPDGDCRDYFVCSSVESVPIRIKCRGRFDPKKGICVRGSCLN